MNDRDRLAADLHRFAIGCSPDIDGHEKAADRLIALGWTRLDIPTRIDARITEPMLRAAMRSAPNLTPHAIWTRLLNLYDFPPDTLDEERLARAIHPYSCGTWHFNSVLRCVTDAAAIAKAYREDTDA